MNVEETKEKVDAYINKHENWRTELEGIRSLLNTSELIEDVKWGMPTYTLNKKNVIGLAAFKHHCGLWFHQGCFLEDKYKILVNAQEGKTKGMRHIKFDENNPVDMKVLKIYIDEAIQNQKEGKEIEITRVKSKLPIPEYMISNLSGDIIEKLMSFSMSKRNEYIEYITNAKRETTKQKRLDKIRSMIDKGVGLNDMYKR